MELSINSTLTNIQKSGIPHCYTENGTPRTGLSVFDVRRTGFGYTCSDLRRRKGKS